jgi:hypothetical protein
MHYQRYAARFQELGGDVSERAGDKGAVASIRNWFEEHGMTP